MEDRNISIEVRELDADNLSYRVDDAVLIRFTNRGTSRIWLDEDEVLEPGEAFIEGDLNGPGISHGYSIKFITNPSPTSADNPKIYSGNRLHLRIFKRIEK